MCDQFDATVIFF